MRKKIKILLFILIFPAVLMAQEKLIDKVLHHNYSLVEDQTKVENEITLLQESLPEFSFECWLVEHVNSPVGFKLINDKGNDLFLFYNNAIQIAGTENIQVKRGFNKYWHHWVINLSGKNLSVFHNGEKVNELVIEDQYIPEGLILKGLTNNEMLMGINDLIKQFTLYSSALDDQTIQDNFESYSSALLNGHLPAQSNQIIVPPFLSLATATTVNLTFETSSDSEGIVKYGTVYPLLNTMEHGTSGKLHNIQLKGLLPETNYFVEVEIKDKQDILSITNLSFKTANTKQESFRFGIIGDTESRPFINAKVAQNLWDNRPDFFLLLGDITDGGSKDFKEQWTLEFLTGANSLMQHVPILPVAGNGDDDLHWFNNYFNPPQKEGFYKYSWGNADFFVLHSSMKRELAPGAKQYKWLENELQKSEAEWKFVMMHHAPYSSDENDYGNSWKGPSDLGDKNIRKMVPLFEKYNVDFVLYGHLHCYERSYPIRKNEIDKENGVVYVVAGGAGGNLENFSPHRTWFSAKTFRGYHYIIANIHKNSIRLDTYNLDGNLIDFYAKTK